jgi:hypothetical protein
MQFLAAILDEASPWTAGEKWVVKWQFRLLGDFGTALAEAICRADDTNLARIAKGFPDEVAGFLAWNRGDLAQRLRAAGFQD